MGVLMPVGSPGQASCGGIVRDSHGRWVFGFSKHIGITNSFVAELWGLRDELILCNNLNIIFLLVELDTKAVVDILNRLDYVNNVVSLILDDCRLLASWFHRIQFKHYTAKQIGVLMCSQRRMLARS